MRRKANKEIGAVDPEIDIRLRTPSPSELRNPIRSYTGTGSVVTNITETGDVVHHAWPGHYEI
jgi:hypothetical protein